MNSCKTRNVFTSTVAAILLSLMLLGGLAPVSEADFTSAVTEAWVCVGNAGWAKIHLSTSNPGETVRVTNLNTGNSRLVTTDGTGDFTGRFESFVSVGNAVGFQVEGQSHPAKDRVSRNCLRNGSGSIMIHEFLDTGSEMLAFEDGDLDIVDWPVPGSNIDEWTDCDGFRDIEETCFDPATNPDAQVTLSTHSDLGMFEYDFNNWLSPTNEPSFRKAVGYLADRQRLAFLGNADPICSALAPGQPGSRDCVSLGYPTAHGELRPSKAIQVLHEGGFTDTNGNGLLELTPGTDVPPIVLIGRIDDPIRTQAALILESFLENLPNSYTSKAGGTVVVCPSTPSCRFDVDARILDRRIAARIVLTGPDWKDWHIYTGGWSLSVDPDHVFFLYTSTYAPVHCGGGWPTDFPTNYPCYVDPGFDQIAQPLATGATYNDLLAAAGAVQEYAWGYDPAQGKIDGTMPTVPLYSFRSTKAAWKRDYGPTPLANPDGSRACWRGFVPQAIGVGLDNLATLTSLYLDNCKTTKADYVSYRGDTRSIIDWGFKSTIQGLNIVTSQWFWDILAMQQTYDSLLGRNPVSLRELVPVLAESYGEARYFNQALQREAGVGLFKFRDGVMWNDGTYATALDVKFSIEYVHCHLGWNFGLVEHVFDSDADSCNGMDGVVVENADPVNGIGGTVYVYFDRVGALFTQSVGFLPVIPRHVWTSLGDGPDGDTIPNEPEDFPDFDFTKHVGTGPYMIIGCSGVDCTGTLTLKPNPYFLEGRHYWSLAARIAVQPDLNGDDQVNSEDLALVNEAASSSETLLDVDYRVEDLGMRSFTNALGPGTIDVMLRGVQVGPIDRYIIERLISESSDPSGLLWPPRRATYTWPDADRDNDVDLDDVIQVFLNQFQPVEPVSSRSINDVDYDRDVDLDDLITTFVFQFTLPPGARG